MSDDVVSIRNVSRQFGTKQALCHVSLGIPRGTVFGLVGQNGAGKTTLLKHVLGLYQPQEGSVLVFGLDPVADPVGVLQRVGFLSEDRDLARWMRIDEVIGYTRSFYPRWDSAYAADLVEMFELNPRQKLSTLSRGQLARTGLLLALAHRPDLLVLDEPSSGLDPVVRRDILSAIVRTVAEDGRTVLFSSHLLDEVERVADQVAMMHAGRLVLSEPVDSIKANYRLLTLRFATPLSKPPRIPGAIIVSGESREWRCLCETDVSVIRQVAVQLGAEVVEESVPSLEEVFVCRTAVGGVGGEG